MSNVPVFLFTNLIINDEEQYREYERGFFPILKKFGGEFITYDDNPITLEGASTPSGRIILFKFPSEQAAKDWYTDPEHQSLSRFRRAGTTLEYLTIIHGTPSR
ncbi:DUF1330 domain-containing protein [Gammaproteobacteria bacterium]|nr:DUF1330 domain-containing protein [Gammaproteobacteria bacterium]MDB2443713.1 DUF1330 domain-containing protein [Gammaproteobacteria bacterium]